MLGGGLVILGSLFLLAPRGVRQADPPPDLTGCYEASGAPRIEIDKSRLHVMQRPALSLPYKVEFNKGWALSLDASLDLVARGADTSIASRPGHGQYVFVTREGELPPSPREFTLHEKSGEYSVRYVLTGIRCAV